MGKKISNSRDEQQLIDKKNERKNLKLKYNGKENLRFMAEYDYLTELPNRRNFENVLVELILGEADIHENTIVLMFIDLDRFKFFNDSLGHNAGDKVLKIVADRINNVVGSENLVARYSGDEFVVLFKGVTDREHINKVAERIQQKLTEPIRLLNNEYSVSASIGISIFPEHTNHLDELVLRADQAMYSAKKKGKNRVEFFNVEIANEIDRKAKIEQNLKKAIDNNELYLEYQPIVNVYNKKIVGFEALLRWKSEKLGSISPGEFIPIAEESDLIFKIGEWVFLEVCEHLSTWSKKAVPSFYISLNMSIKQFEQHNLVPKLEQHIEDFGVNVDLIKIEITESTAMKNSEEILSKLNELNNLGIEIFLDDFGTGFSSLSYFEKLPVSLIKIDKSFIKDITQHKKRAAITRAIVAMTKSLKIKVLAEGVEEIEQYQYLCSIGCHFMQGYYFGKPVPFNYVEAFFHSTK
ncbi:hypothetical protein BKP45_07990 [Anaerobacillus alkalidiazotrophicus]|uniref:Diguanylate cyclase n=1 Tax=Anaerobacillus alkalidiazotrophicus TaxID=472963 RepID=A0A1S2M7U2_9BACI|nr:bifunctional diguanylate cyclase/phosphodiesterase [Anaerobacillus alkalidiazotrophicus]OIJ20731.1 hypothetical protein BKP45_07990 [Anaerobacillus alkalidiazotrophicus]